MTINESFTVGELYKLKSIPGLKQDTRDYKIINIVDNIVVCKCVDSGEVFYFMSEFLIDPEKPEETTYNKIQKVENINCNRVVMNFTGGLKIDIDEDACAAVAAAVSTGQVSQGCIGQNLSCPTLGSIHGAMVNGVPTAGKSHKKKKKKKKNEDLEQDIELFELTLDNFRQYTNAETMQDATNKMIDYFDNIDTIKKYDLLAEFISYCEEQGIEESQLQLDSIESLDEDYNLLADTIAQRLKQLNFEFADTTDIVYKKEGKYKYLIKFDNENSTLKYKIVQGDSVLGEKLYNINTKEDVDMVFEYVEKTFNHYEKEEE